MTTLKYTPLYVKVTATLAQEFYDYGMKDKFPNIDWDDPWMKLCEVPELVERCHQVEEKLDYELSWNQCCNAVSWAVKVDPKEWTHLLGEN